MEPIFKEEISIYRNHYPCAKCPQKDSCGAEHGCLSWRDWFGITWRQVRKKFNKI